MIKMAKVTYLHDLITRQFQQIMDLDKKELFWDSCKPSRRQAKVAGRSSKVANQLLDLDWAAMIRPTQAPDTFTIGYGNEQSL